MTKEPTSRGFGRFSCAIFPLILFVSFNLGVLGADKPNIVFLLADDLGYGDLGSYGGEMIDTPHLDQLALEGMRFTQAYAGGPVCTSSRSVLMTGLHGGHTPARDNIPHYHTYLQEKDITMAEMLKNAGYQCAGVGKWSLGDAGTVGRATNQGFDHWFGYLNQDHAHYYYPEYLDDDEDRLVLENNSRTRKHYSHDLLIDRALEFMRNAKEAPFFFYGAFTLPHYSSTDEDEDKFAVPSTEPYTNEHWSEKSKKYAAMVHRLDQGVGKIVGLLNELGLRENTLIIFTSDNGGHQDVWKGFNTNGPLRGYKRSLYEGGIRVPFIASWPGMIRPNSVNGAVIAFQDMMPTFAELARANMHEKMDGHSVLAAFKEADLPERTTPLYWDYGHGRDRYDQAVRIGPWKGIRFGQDNPIQLYDLSVDWAETSDVAALHPDVLFKMIELMKQEFEPNPRYEVGNRYQGGPIWRKTWN